MKKYEYTIKENKVIAIDQETSIFVYDLSAFAPELMMRYRSLLAQKQDMNYAHAYLKQMFFDEGTSLIDGALINSTIQLLVKCFSRQKGDGRKPLDAKKVFKKHAQEIGEKDLTKQFQEFYDARNQVIAHDEFIFKENLVGISVNLNSNTAEEIASLTIKKGFLYKNNQQLLLRMVNVVQSYIASQMLAIETKLVDEYNKSEIKPSLSLLFCEDIPISNAW